MPAVCVVAGIGLAWHLTWLGVSHLIVLLALGLAVRRAWGLALACLAWGLLLGWVYDPRVGAGTPPFDLERPVEMLVRATGHPVIEDAGSRLRVRAMRLRQGRRVFTVPIDVWLDLPNNLEPPPIGSILRLQGFLRRSRGYANPGPRRPATWNMRLKSRHFLTVEEPPAGIDRLAAVLHWRLIEGLAEVSPSGRGTELITALVLGDRSRLPRRWQQALRRAGLEHLLAVSGLHVGMLGWLLYLAGMALPRRLRLLLVLVGVAIYFLLIGPRPSVLRASLMAVLGLGALLSERPPQVLNALACAVLWIVHWDPLICASLGFQLSVAATAGIVVLTPKIERRFVALPGWLRRPLAASCAAQGATLPWTLLLTAGIHPLAPLLTLVAVPWLGVFLFSAFLFVVVVLVRPEGATLFLPWIDALAGPLDALSLLPASSLFFVPCATGWGCLMILLLVIAMVGLRWGSVLWVVLVAIYVVPSWSRGAAAESGHAEIVLLDVGQGDALLLREGSKAILVDGGGWRHGDFGGKVLLPALAAQGIERLQAVVSTHPDLDHCSGLADLAHYLPVEEIWMGPGWRASCTSRLLSQTGARWRVLFGGQTVKMGRWHFQVLHPGAGERRGRNDRSLVLLASYGEVRMLLTGDIEAATESRLVRAQGRELRADLLKVAHHGSRTSTSEAFLRAVQPRLALISAGLNHPYGHPSGVVLERLQTARVRVLRSDLSGMVRIRAYPNGRLIWFFPTDAKEPL